jgi:hypothetical protein
MLLYIIGLILCYTYNLPVAVTVLCWVGTFLSFIRNICGFVKQVIDED